MNTKLLFTMAVAATAFVVPVAGYAADEYNVSSGITTSGVALGVHGFDTVALSTGGSVIHGEATHTIVNDGVAYYFATAEAASLFANDPEKYAPQYGGFCAYAVALGKKFDGDPRFADIVAGKLYLFVNASIFAEYKKDKENILKEADKMWAGIRSTAVEELR